LRKREPRKEAGFLRRGDDADQACAEAAIALRA
jgi:hypothetical protein